MCGYQFVGFYFVYQYIYQVQVVFVVVCVYWYYWQEVFVVVGLQCVGVQFLCWGQIQVGQFDYCWDLCGMLLQYVKIGVQCGGGCWVGGVEQQYYVVGILQQDWLQEVELLLFWCIVQMQVIVVGQVDVCIVYCDCGGCFVGIGVVVVVYVGVYYCVGGDGMYQSGFVVVYCFEYYDFVFVYCQFLVCWCMLCYIWVSSELLGVLGVCVVMGLVGVGFSVVQLYRQVGCMKVCIVLVGMFSRWLYLFMLQVCLSSSEYSWKLLCWWLSM